MVVGMGSRQPNTDPPAIIDPSVMLIEEIGRGEEGGWEEGE